MRPMAGSRKMAWPPVDNQGFSLLEAIVALLLLSTMGLALFNLLNSTLETVSRLEAHSQENQAFLNAVAYLKNINMTARPKGDVELDGLHIRWSAQAVVPLTSGAGRLGGGSLYAAGLYQVEVEVTRDTRQLTAFTVLAAGFEVKNELVPTNEFRKPSSKGRNPK